MVEDTSVSKPAADMLMEEQLRQHEKQIDIKIGATLRYFRLQKAVTQMALAKGVGVTFQQIQKYEKGLNRVSFSRLLSMLDFLDQDIGSFFKKAELLDEIPYTTPIQPIAHQRQIHLLFQMEGLSPTMLAFAEENIRQLARLQSRIYDEMKIRPTEPAFDH